METPKRQSAIFDEKDHRRSKSRSVSSGSIRRKSRDESAKEDLSKKSRDESAKEDLSKKSRDGSAREDLSRKSRDGSAKEDPSKGRQRNSLIPLAKGDLRGDHQKERKSYSTSKLCCAAHKIEKVSEDLESKLKLLEEKEKSIAQYYVKIEDLIRSLNENEPREKENSSARKMISEPLLCSKEKLKNSIWLDLENNIQEISKIWLKASTECALKNLRSNPSLDPMEVELEKVKIRLAIKQTKSLTLVKTRDIILEAKKLFRHGEIIRGQLENFISEDILKKDSGRCECLRAETSKKEDTSTSPKNEEKERVGATGDSQSDIESQELSMSYTESTSSENERVEMPGTGEEITKSEGREDSSSEEKCIEARHSRISVRAISPRKSENCDVWARDLAKKNETITSLNNRIFELQKTCNEHSSKYNQLQVVLSQFEEKTKWNQVLWKQISKLKDQIKSLSQRNKNLECQKADLEQKILGLDQELERLFKVNHYLHQKKNLSERLSENRPSDYQREKDSSKPNSRSLDKREDCGVLFDDKVLEEKQNAINQLKKILDIMREQEDFAQKQISVFQQKIEELEKNTQL